MARKLNHVNIIDIIDRSVNPPRAKKTAHRRKGGVYFLRSSMASLYLRAERFDFLLWPRLDLRFPLRL